MTGIDNGRAVRRPSTTAQPTFESIMPLRHQDTNRSPPTMLSTPPTLSSTPLQPPSRQTPQKSPKPTKKPPQHSLKPFQHSSRTDDLCLSSDDFGFIREGSEGVDGSRLHVMGNSSITGSQEVGYSYTVAAAADSLRERATFLDISCIIIINHANYVHRGIKKRLSQV